MSELDFNNPQYAPMKMVERAVRHAKSRKRKKEMRWVVMMDIFGYGSTTSTQLCTTFGLDPNELV